jgi:hypothetical protein
VLPAEAAGHDALHEYLKFRELLCYSAASLLPQGFVLYYPQKPLVAPTCTVSAVCCLLPQGFVLYYPQKPLVPPQSAAGDTW